MTTVNGINVPEFANGLVTQILSGHPEYTLEARVEFDQYDKKFDVVTFLAGMISGLLEGLAPPDGFGLPLPPDEIWRQYLLDWQAHHGSDES